MTGLGLGSWAKISREEFQGCPVRSVLDQQTPVWRTVFQAPPRSLADAVRR